MTRIWLLAAALGAAACSASVPLPEKALALNQSGAQALAEGDLEAAAARLEVALEYSPHFVEALVNLGLVEMQRGNFRRARQLLERARRMNPDVAQPHHALGVLAERERRHDRASEHYRQALAVDPGFTPARANLGRLLFDAGQLDAALLTFRRLLELAPEDVSGYLGSVETLLRLRRFAEADALLSVARARFANQPELQILAARSLLRQGHVAPALELLAPLARGRDDVAAAALAWLGAAELASARPRRAVAAADRALALEPEHPVALHVLAQALSALGDPSAASWSARARAQAKKP